jgi:hypothetical protein
MLARQKGCSCNIISTRDKKKGEEPTKEGKQQKRKGLSPTKNDGK